MAESSGNTQSGALTVSRVVNTQGSDVLRFTSTGGNIDLTNPGNTISGSQARVGFAAPHSSQAVQFTKSSTDLLQVGA